MKVREAVRDEQGGSNKDSERRAKSARSGSDFESPSSGSGSRADIRASSTTAMEGFGDFLRSLPERLRRPESLLMALALFASVGAHLPPYIGLGALAEYFEHHPPIQKPKPAPVEVSFEVSDVPAEPEVVKPEEPKPEPQDKSKPEPPKPKPEKVAQPEPEKPKAPDLVPKQEEPKPEQEKPKVAVSEVEVEQPPPPPKQERKQSVTQKSEDPNVEPPPDAKYLAEENQRVEQETMASVTSETRDDDKPQASNPMAAGAEKAGADVQDDTRGAEKGSEDEEAPKVATASQPPPAAQPTQAPTPSKPATAPREAVSPTPSQPTIVQDPLGSFVLTPAVPGREGKEGEKGQRGVAGTPGPNLKVSWRAFEQTFGEQQLAQDRMPREAKRRGAGREKRWEEFRAAIENYIVGVKPGNQTKLNAAADPFAAYLAAFHRNLHMEFAQEFLESLSSVGEMGDPDLVTKVEIVVNADGTLDRVGVVKSSGNLMYDFGAFNAVQRGAPYPPPPEKIRSSDGRVYMRWALHRNESQCGTWNAEPYILKNPPSGPHDPKGDGISPFRSPSEQKGERPQNAPPGSAPRAGETLGLNQTYSPRHKTRRWA